jgi:FkbM family methyltransferase
MDKNILRFNISYAQNREDILLSGFFSTNYKGFYVDVGASDPTKFSVTKLFYDRGWSGINIEPLPNLYRLLKKDRTRDINLNIGISDKKGKLTLREYPDFDGLSTFSPSMKNFYSKQDPNTVKKYIDHNVQVLTLREVFREQGAPVIDFMKVDVEGLEYEVLAGNDWQVYRPKVLCIEANHVIKDWRTVLEKNKYKLLFFDGLNEYYVANEQPEIASRFSYIHAVLEKPPIPVEFYDIHREIEKELATARSNLETSQSEIIMLNLEAKKLNLEIVNLNRPSVQIVGLARNLDGAILRRLESKNTISKIARRVYMSITRVLIKPFLIILRHKKTQKRANSP